MGGTGGKNIEYPHTLESLSSVLFCSRQIHFYCQCAIQASYAVMRQLLFKIFDPMTSEYELRLIETNSTFSVHF